MKWRGWFQDSLLLQHGLCFAFWELDHIFNPAETFPIPSYNEEAEDSCINSQ